MSVDQKNVAFHTTPLPTPKHHRVALASQLQTKHEKQFWHCTKCSDCIGATFYNKMATKMKKNHAWCLQFSPLRPNLAKMKSRDKCVGVQCSKSYDFRSLRPSSCTACAVRTQRLGYSPKNTRHLTSSTAKQQGPHENNESAFNLVINCRYEQATQPCKVQLCKGMQDAHPNSRGHTKAWIASP